MFQAADLPGGDRPENRTWSSFRDAAPLEPANATFEWASDHLAKQREAKGRKESPKIVSGGEASLPETKPSAKSVTKGKLPPKNKSRLPRREKKAQRKTAGRS
jgi:hypothetical protein